MWCGGVVPGFSVCGGMDMSEGGGDMRVVWCVFGALLCGMSRCGAHCVVLRAERTCCICCGVGKVMPILRGVGWRSDEDPCKMVKNSLHPA